MFLGPRESEGGGELDVWCSSTWPYKPTET